MEKILSKRQFYDLWDRGILGNKPHTWVSLDEAIESGFKGLVAIRYRGAFGNGPFVPNLTIDSLEEEVEKLIVAGWKKEDFNFSEQLSPETAIYLINGEVTRSHRGLELRFSRENKLMRDALQSSEENAYGMKANEVLKLCLRSNDREELLELLDTWPDHVVEFSGFDRPVGIYQTHMVIWEVRLY